MKYQALSIGVLCLLCVSQATADQLNLTGSYADVDGDTVKFSHSGKSIQIAPSEGELPPQIIALLGEIALRGAIKTEGSKNFSLQAKFEKDVSPVEGTKMKISIGLSAAGEQASEGLMMKACNWDARFVIIVDGKEQADENVSENCVGLWKKR